MGYSITNVEEFRGNGTKTLSKMIRVGIICKVNDDGSKKFIDVSLEKSSLKRKLNLVKFKRNEHYIVFCVNFEPFDKVKDLLIKIDKGIKEKDITNLDIIEDIHV